jgi:hypothetical protein
MCLACVQHWHGLLPRPLAGCTALGACCAARCSSSGTCMPLGPVARALPWAVGGWRRPPACLLSRERDTRGIPAGCLCRSSRRLYGLLGRISHSITFGPRPLGGWKGERALGREAAAGKDLGVGSVGAWMMDGPDGPDGPTIQAICSHCACSNNMMLRHRRPPPHNNRLLAGWSVRRSAKHRASTCLLASARLASPRRAWTTARSLPAGVHPTPPTPAPARLPTPLPSGCALPAQRPVSCPRERRPPSCPAAPGSARAGARRPRVSA